MVSIILLHESLLLQLSNIQDGPRLSMRLYLLVKLKYESNNIILGYSLVLDILCVTYFQTSIIMPYL